MIVHMDVVNLNIPLIIGLYVLKAHKLLVNYVDNGPHFCNEGVKQPLTYKLGHFFFEWNTNEMFLTLEDLTRLHLHFM